MRQWPETASVVISSYNYARFLRNAIESALSQTRPPSEVIVADDGSVDGSRAVIQSFGNRVRVVLKENGGHASAINAGCRLAHGDVVFLLDADDELRPDAIAAVLAAWRPETVMMHWRPSQMDADGHDIEGTVPAPWIRLEEGDLRERVLTAGSYATTVTSGLALRRDALQRILPIPEETFRQGADGYLVRAIVFCGQVQAIDRPLTRYRRHGGNDSEFGASSESVASALRKRIDLARNELGIVHQVARQYGFEASLTLGESDPEFLFARFASAKVAPASHPIADDTRARLLPRLLKAQWRSERPLSARTASAVCTISVALLPRSLAWRLLAMRYSRAARPGWLVALGRLRRRNGSRTRTTAGEMSVTTPATTSTNPPGASPLSRDAHTALRNGIKLAMSLVATWGVGIVVRFWMPRQLGPSQFGLYSFADGLAAALIGCAGLGIDTYIQKEIPVRPQHASEFYGGTVTLRVTLSALLVGTLMVVPVGARGPSIRWILLAFGVGQIVFALNGTLAVLLQANTTVDELAVANVAAKIVWGVGIAAALFTRAPLWTLASVFAISESLKLLLLQAAAGHHLGLRFRLDLAATRAAVASSLGFYMYTLVLALSWRLDVALLGYLAHDTDVGWYGASQSLATITLLMEPLMGSVLAPLLRRAFNRSLEEMLAVTRRALEGLVLITTPIALFLALGADLWVRIAFGAAYAPAAGTLRTLAPLFVLTYLAILLSMALVVLGRGWTLTLISLSAIVVHVAMALAIVPAFSRWLGAGGAGIGMALSSVSKELFVTATLTIVLGHGFLDRPRQRILLRTGLAAVGTTAGHMLLASIGYWRLPVDASVYAALAFAFGVFHPASSLAFARELLNARRERP